MGCRTSLIYKYVPPKINRRILAQQSVFLINLTGKIDKQRHNNIIIPAKNKQSILSDLEKIGISQKTLFHDFTGFVEWFIYDERDKYDSLVYDAEKYFENTENEKAQISIEKAIHLGKKLRINNSEMASLYHSYGYSFDEQGYYANALKQYKKALSIYEKELGREHPATTTTLNNIALIYDTLGQYDKALEMQYKIVLIEQKVLGAEHPDLAVSYNNIGLAYDHKKDYENALKYYHKAFDIYKKVFREGHYNIVTAYLNISTIYYKQNNYENSLKWSIQALKCTDKEYPVTVKVYNNIALIYYKQGRYQDALDECNKAISICKGKS